MASRALAKLLPILLTIFVTLNLGYLYHLTQRVAPYQHLQTTFLRWSSNCGVVVPKIHPAFAALEMPEFAVTTSLQAPTCESSEFSSHTRGQANSFFLEFAGYPNYQASVSQDLRDVHEPSGIYLEQLTLDNEVVARTRLALPRVFPAEAWKRVQVPLPSGDSTKFRLRLHDSSEGKAWVALRPSIELYQSDQTLQELRTLLAKNPWRLLLQVLIVGLIASATFWLAWRERSVPWQLGVFFFSSLLLHFRVDLFFRNDEWQILDRFADTGWSATLAQHNEHFIPLYLGSYFLQRLVFANWYQGYIVISLLLHSLNGVLLLSLLQGIGKLSGEKLSRKEADTVRLKSVSVSKVRDSTSLSLLGDAPLYGAAVFATQLYILSALHGEMLQWVAVQGQIFAILLELLCLKLLLKYYYSPQRSYLAVATLLAFLASLFFATGIIAPLHAIAFLLIFPPLRSAIAIIVLGLSSLASLLVYSATSVTSAPGITRLLENPLLDGASYFTEMVQYFCTAFFGGALLRGLTLSSATTLAEFAEELPLVLTTNLGVVGGISLVGVGVLAGFTVYYFSTRSRDYRLQCLILSLVILSSSLLLPTLGRAMLGPQHGLTWRYHSYALVGLSFLVYPVLIDLFSHAVARQWRILRLGVLVGGSLFIFWQQASLSRSQTLLWREGATMHHWFQRVSHFSSGMPLLEDQSETDPEVLYYDSRGKRANPSLDPATLRRLLLTTN